jgi:hypothetical protein
MASKHVKKFDMIKQIRFEFIETRLLWGKGLTAKDLTEAFEITRQSAQRTLDEYRQRHPRQMQYDARQKCHVPDSSFEPQYIRKAPLKFLDYLRGQNLVGFYREQRSWTDIEITDVDRHLRPELPLEPIQNVISALLQQQAVHIDYQSKTMDSAKSRSISPNHLIFADGRYHVRAYCHFRERFLDFVLSRILRAETTDEEWVSSAADENWNTFVEIRFYPNPDLPSEVKKAILKNYETEDSGHWIIRCRKALAHYIKRKQLSPNPKFVTALWCTEMESEKST